MKYVAIISRALQIMQVAFKFHGSHGTRQIRPQAKRKLKHLHDLHDFLKILFSILKQLTRTVISVIYSYSHVIRITLLFLEVYIFQRLHSILFMGLLILFLHLIKNNIIKIIETYNYENDSRHSLQETVRGLHRYIMNQCMLK